MIIRELLTRFGIDYDNTGFKKADRAVNTLKKKTSSMGTAANAAFGNLTRLFGAFAGIYGAKRLIEMGSAANETLNVLNEVFKQNSQAVQDWARAFGKDVGRSEYEMRELAATLGAILNPMTDQNVEATTKMSEGLAQLAVDLGSFYNAADSDVLIALRAAIVGETEPMRRFGVDMQVAALTAYALEKGIRKSYKTMSTAEKTALRYEFILDKTRQAQGDAKRTSDGYANAIKGVTGAIKDLAIGLMLRVMPWISKFTSYARDKVIPVLKDILDKSNIVMSALIVLGGALLLAWAPTLIPMLATLGTLAAIALMMDEVITTFQGGETKIKDAVDKAFGPGTTQQYIEDTKNGLKMLGETWTRTIKEMVKDPGEPSKGRLKKLLEESELIAKALDKIRGFFEWYDKTTKSADNWIANIAKTVDDWFDNNMPGFDKGDSDKINKKIFSALKYASGIEGIEYLKGLADDLVEDAGLENVGKTPYIRSYKKTKGRGVDAPLQEEKPHSGVNAREKPSVSAPIPWSVEEDIPWSAPQSMKGPIVNRSSTAINQSVNVTNNVSVPEGASGNDIAVKLGRETLKAVTDQPKNIRSALRQGK